jgi:hypothetical protein
MFVSSLLSWGILQDPECPCRGLRGHMTFFNENFFGVWIWIRIQQQRRSGSSKLSVSETLAKSINQYKSCFASIKENKRTKFQYHDYEGMLV